MEESKAIDGLGNQQGIPQKKCQGQAEELKNKLGWWSQPHS